MSSIKIYPEPEINRREILRYAMCRGEDEQTAELLDDCIKKARGVLEYRVCFDRFPVSVSGSSVDLGFVQAESKNLAKNLSGCHEAVIFAATAGLGLDRLILRAGRTAPAQALFFQAIGAERIEALCDCFNAEITGEAAQNGLFTRPRFSPGYGDLPLALQRDIFRALGCTKAIGLTLNDSLLMSPSKSVTAIIGISDECAAAPEKCAVCSQSGCKFKRRDTK